MLARRIFTLFLFVAILLSTASCDLFSGNFDESGDGNESRAPESNVSVNPKTELIAEGMTISENLTPEEHTARYNEMLHKYKRYELFFMGSDGQIKNSINLTDALPPETIRSISTIQSSANGGLFITATGWFDGKTGIEPICILKLNADGSVEGELVELIPHRESAVEERYYYTVAFNEQGYLFASGYSSSEDVTYYIIDVFDADGNFVFSIKNEPEKSDGWSFTHQFFVDKNTVYTAFRANQDWASYLAPVDIDGQKLGEKFKINADPQEASIRDGVIYTHSAHGLQSFDIRAQKSSILFLWKDQDIELSASSVIPLALSEDAVFLTSKYTYNDRIYTELYMLNRAETNPNAGKTIIQIGGFNLMGNKTLGKVIREFNKNNREYRAEALDYYALETLEDISEDDYQRKQNAINMMILAGDIPDILVGSYYNCNFPLYASKGLFADLNEYIDNDSEFNRADYTDLMFTLPATDDKLYYTFANYGILGIMSKKDTLEGGAGWTLDELSLLCDTAAPGQSVMPLQSYNTLLRYIMTGTLLDFVDNVNHTADFNTESFRKILDFCKNYGVSDTEIEAERQRAEVAGIWIPPMENIKNGTLLIDFIDGNLYTVDDWKYLWNMTDGNITLSGFPTDTGTTLLCAPGDYIAISRNRGNQDIAWELTKSLLFEIAESSYIFSVRNDVLEEKIQEQMKPVAEIYSPEVIPLTEEGAQEFRRILASATELADYDATIMSIIEIESAAYFAGQKSVEDVVTIIQDRVQTYLNQQ